MWTWEKIAKCKEIKRGVLVDSIDNELYQSVLVDKINDSLRVADGLKIYSYYHSEDYSSFKFYHTTGEEILPPKERETITLYETMDKYGNVKMCDEDGYFPNFVDKKMDIALDSATISRKANINKNKYMVIYADTFEVKEWSS